MLSGLQTIPVCVSYMFKGKKLEYYPVSAEELEQCQPVYKEFSGWNENLRSCQKWEDLPSPAKTLVQFIEKSLKILLNWYRWGLKEMKLLYFLPKIACNFFLKTFFSFVVCFIKPPFGLEGEEMRVIKRHS